LPKRGAIANFRNQALEMLTISFTAAAFVLGGGGV